MVDSLAVNNFERLTVLEETLHCLAMYSRLDRAKKLQAGTEWYPLPAEIDRHPK